MSVQRDPDDTMRLWLEEGPNDLPRDTARAIDVATRSAPQRRRALRLPWGYSPTPLAARLLGAAAIVAVLVVGVALFRPGLELGGIGGVPAFSPSPVPSPTLPPLDTSDWVTYVSDVYGLSIAHPPTWDVSPSTGMWDSGGAVDFPADPRWDTFESKETPNSHLIVSVWSAQVEPGITLEEWIAPTCDEGGSTPCSLAMSRARPVVTESSDRHEGLLVPFQYDTQAFFLDGDRMFVVAAWRNERDYDAGRFVEAFAKTLCLGTPERPCEGASLPSVEPSAEPSP